MKNVAAVDRKTIYYFLRKICFSYKYNWKLNAVVSQKSSLLVDVFVTQNFASSEINHIILCQ